MNVKEQAEMIGKRGLLDMGGVCYPVEIIMVRKVYGRTDYQVIPVNGKGNVWVESSRVQLS